MLSAYYDGKSKYYVLPLNIKNSNNFNLTDNFFYNFYEDNSQISFQDNGTSNIIFPLI